MVKRNFLKLWIVLHQPLQRLHTRDRLTLKPLCDPAAPSLRTTTTSSWQGTLCTLGCLWHCSLAMALPSQDNLSIMYNSGFGKADFALQDCSTSSRVASVYSRAIEEHAPLTCFEWTVDGHFTGVRAKPYHGQVKLCILNQLRTQHRWDPYLR